MNVPQHPRHQPPDYEAPPEEDLDAPDLPSQRSRLGGLLDELVPRLHWIVLGLVLGAVGSLYYLSKAPEQYRATATLMVKQQVSSMMAKDQSDAIDLRSGEAVNTMAERIKRLELLERVAAREEIRGLPGLVPPPVRWLPEASERFLGIVPPTSAAAEVPAPPELAARLSGWLGVSLRRHTRLLDISVTHPKKEVAQALADAVALEAQAELSDSRSEGRVSSIEILVRESEAARLRLQAAQNSLATYESALKALGELEQKQTAAADLSRRYLAKHPKMATAVLEAGEAEEKFLREFEAAREAPTDRAHWQSSATEWEVATGADRLKTARRMLRARSTVLGSEIESQTNVFNSILTRIQEGDINQRGVESEMEISSFARLPHSPVAPRRPQVIAAGSTGGLAAGLTFALLLVRLDSRLRTVAQAAHICGVPVLGAIPQIHPKTLALRAARASALQQAAWHSSLVLREGLLDSPVAQTFQVLRTSLSLLDGESQRSVILFSSALPGEGKTLVSSNFALAAAQQGRRTLLIDLDLLKPSVHSLFGLRRSGRGTGSSDVLAGRAALSEAVLTASGQENLHLVLAGAPVPRPGELLRAAALKELLDAAAAEYDLVVVDSPPLLAVPDTRILATLVDSFCLIARADHLPKSALRAAMSLLKADGNPPCGLVFNGFRNDRRFAGQDYYRYGAYQASYGAYGYGRQKNA